MFLQEHRRWKLIVAILTLSLLTVMAGAAVAPALGVIQEYFSGESKMMVQLIISMPAVFIAVTNLFFGKLCRICKAKTLTLIGLGMYIVFGCGAGLFSNIYLVLVCRALVGVVATLIAGALAMISWRMSFLVYLLGVVSIIPVALWMPNERIIEAGQQKKSTAVFRNYYSFIVGMFFLMVIFFNYPANFAMESSRLGTVSEAAIPVIMAFGDVFGFLGGLAYPKLKTGLGRGTKIVAPLMFLGGYLLLQFWNAMPGILLGSFLIGAANGIGVPYFISTASAKAGRNAATTVIPALSVALYIAQFTTPAIVTVCEKILGIVIANVTSYHVAILLLCCSPCGARWWWTENRQNRIYTFPFRGGILSHKQLDSKRLASKRRANERSDVWQKK